MAEAGEREKGEHYRGLAEPYTLTPAVVEQYGRCGKLADEMLNELADHRTAKLLSAPREGIAEHPMLCTIGSRARYSNTGSGRSPLHFTSKP